MNKQEIIIVKLGGSVISDKNKPLSIRKDVINRLIYEIIQSGKKIVLVHGGGSYGHPLAKKYQIQNGFNNKIENQVLGLAETHQAMDELNSIIIEEFLNKKFPAISLQPSSTFIFNPDLQFFGTEHLEYLLDLGIIPVLYGDIVLKKNDRFSILSGDTIIQKICGSLQRYKVSKVIFTIEEDGVIGKENQSDNKPFRLLEKIPVKNIDNIILKGFDEKIDVTGGIKGKLNSIAFICENNITAQIINGLKEGYLLKALTNKNLPSTLIF